MCSCCMTFSVSCVGECSVREFLDLENDKIMTKVFESSPSLVCSVPVGNILFSVGAGDLCEQLW